MHRLNWDDLQYVLAVVEAGSVAGAARALGVNHTTVLRRIAAVEDRLGTQVFERSAQGYAVRADRLRLIEAAREVGLAVRSVEQLAQGLDAPLTGHVRITSTDTLCQTVLPGILSELYASATELRLSLISSNQHLDLSRLEAELTVRPAEKLAEGLVGQVAAHMQFAVYGARENGGSGWLGLAGAPRRSRPGVWVEDQAGAAGFVATSDSFLVLRDLAARGVGQAVLPCLIGEPDSRLARLDRAMPVALSVPVWVACHEELAHVPRLVQLRAMLIQSLARRARVLARPAG